MTPWALVRRLLVGSFIALVASASMLAAPVDSLAATVSYVLLVEVPVVLFMAVLVGLWIDWEVHR